MVSTVLKQSTFQISPSVWVHSRASTSCTKHSFAEKSDIVLAFPSRKIKSMSAGLHKKTTEPCLDATMGPQFTSWVRLYLTLLLLVVQVSHYIYRAWLCHCWFLSQTQLKNRGTAPLDRRQERPDWHTVLIVTTTGGKETIKSYNRSLGFVFLFCFCFWRYDSPRLASNL